MEWTTVLALGLAFVSAVAGIPQLARTISTGDVSGVSVPTQLAWSASWALWIVHSAAIGAYPKAVGEVVGLLFDTVLLVVLCRAVARATGRRAWSVAVGSAWALVPVPVLALAAGEWGPLALAVGLSLFDVAAMAPQAWTALRAASLNGLSLGSWSLRVAVSGGWIGYGLAIGHPEAVGWAFVMLPVAAAVCARIAGDRRRTSFRATATHGATVAGQPKQLAMER